MKNTQDPQANDPDPDGNNEGQDFQRGGEGAASALVRMKADHAMRHKHRHGHGARATGPGHEDDQTPQR